tara:strand:+ start:129 stop:392 length:264 start_codon:yes stop_codon:yes gene_type:complete
MIKNLITLFISILILLFLFQTTNYYFSDNNIDRINKNNSSTNKYLLEKTLNLSVLKNDTNDVIEFNNGFNINNSTKPKRKFWELITN